MIYEPQGRFDAALAKAFHPVVLAWCWLTGKDNFALARWLRRLAPVVMLITFVAVGLLLPSDDDDKKMTLITAAGLLALLYFLVVLDMKRAAEQQEVIERSVKNGKAGALSIDTYEACIHVSFHRQIDVGMSAAFGAMVLWRPGQLYWASFGMVMAASRYALTDFQPPGQSVLSRLKDRLPQVSMARPAHAPG